MRVAPQKNLLFSARKSATSHGQPFKTETPFMIKPLGVPWSPHCEFSLLQ